MTKIFFIISILCLGSVAFAEKCYEVSSDAKTWSETTKTLFCTDKDDLTATEPQTFTIRKADSDDATVTFKGFHLSGAGFCPDGNNHTNSYRSDDRLGSPLIGFDLIINHCPDDLPAGVSFALEIGPNEGQRKLLYARPIQ